MNEPKKIYIHAAAALSPHGAIDITERHVLVADPDTDTRALTKRVLGQGLRQGSHFVELAAIGARLCLDRVGHATPPDMAVYFGTALGDVRKTEALFRQVMPPGPGVAAPFDFINATANMAAFYVARLAGASARNVTVTQGMFSFEWALRLALDDLGAGAVTTALVGGVDENCFPRADYLRRWRLRDDQIMGEGSAWLFLSTEADGAMAELLSVRLLPAISQDAAAWAHAVSAHIAKTDGSALTLIPGTGLTEPYQVALEQKLAGVAAPTDWHCYLEFCGCYPTAAGFGMVDCLERALPAPCVHVNRDADGVTMLISWRRIQRA